MRSRACLVAFCVAVLCACNGEKRRLMAHLEELEQQRAALALRIDNRKSAIRSTERRIDALNADLAEHNSQVHAFIFQHKAATACIRAATIALAADNEYSQQIAGAARWGAALCAVGLLNPRFAQEVTDVADKLTRDDARARNLKEQIAGLLRTIDAERSDLHTDESALEKIASEMADVRYRLSSQ